MDEIGLEEPYCPHCGGQLARFPLRKTSCPHCAGIILSRTRPDDRRKIIIRPDQEAQLEAQWEAAGEVIDTLREYAAHFPEEFRPIVQAVQNGAVKASEVDTEAMFAFAMRLAHDRMHDGIYVWTCPFCHSVSDPEPAKITDPVDNPVTPEKSFISTISQTWRAFREKLR